MALLFEILVALGVIVQPIPGLGGPFSQAWQAAMLASGLYVSIAAARRRSRRLCIADAKVPLMFLLSAQCSGGFTQLTTVLAPRTVLKSATEVVAGNGALGEPLVAASVATSHLAMLIVALCAVAIWLLPSQRTPQHNAYKLRMLFYSTMGAGVLCIGLPVASSPFWADMPRGSLFQSAAAAAFTPARMGAICFPIIWVTIVAIDVVRSNGNRAPRTLKSAAILALLLVVALAYRSEAKPFLAISLAFGVGTLAQLPEPRWRHFDAVSALHARRGSTALFALRHWPDFHFLHVGDGCSRIPGRLCQRSSSNLWEHVTRVHYRSRDLHVWLGSRFVVGR